MPKFFRRGISKARFLPAVAAANLVPTRAEITAGTDLSPSIADMTGWEFSNSAIATPNLAERFTGNIPGEDTVGDSAIVLYDDDAGSALRTLLAKGTNGFLLWMPYGDVPTKRAEVFPIRVAVISDEKSMGNDAARFSVGCSVTAEPNTGVTIPA